MLRAVLSGKAGRLRVEGAELPVSWRVAFRHNEDLLTAAFFGRMNYLSAETLSELMTALVGDEALRLGMLKELELWPHLKAPGRSWIEPDALMQFENATVLVEVKPPHWGSQSALQWSEQIRALAHEQNAEYRLDTELVHFLALGGNGVRLSGSGLESLPADMPFDLQIHQREWSNVGACLTDLDLTDRPSDAAIVGDLRSVLELYGVSKPIPSWHTLLKFAQRQTLDAGCVRCLGDHRSPPRSSGGLTECPWLPLVGFSRHNTLKWP